MNELATKEKIGRPTVLNDEIINFVAMILSNPNNALLYTDEDIREEINFKFGVNIQPGTFRSWLNRHPAFATAIKRARRKQRDNLILELRTEKQGWQRFAWLLERKFYFYWFNLMMYF